MTHNTPDVAPGEQANEDVAAAGLAEIQLAFDESMARFASLFEVWTQTSREIVGQQSSSALVLDCSDSGPTAAQAA